ncbi:hypothetical protein Tco_0184594 [Tanacetum coccineum]
MYQEEKARHYVRTRYVDDIIFGFTKQFLVYKFKNVCTKDSNEFPWKLTFYGTTSEATSERSLLRQDKFQVTPKVSHLNVVKRIFRYLKHQPKLSLWYPRDSPFELEAYLDSDYGGASLDRKSTTEYVAAANFMGSINGIKSYEDNGQSILRSDSHFIRDLYENRLIELSRFIVDLMFAEPSHQGFDVHQRFKLLSQLDTFVPMDFEATKARLKRYREELQTTTSKKQKIDDKDVPAIGEKVVEVKEEEPVKRTGKRKKQKARIGISVDKNAQGDSETDKEESVEAINPTPLLQTLK